MLWELPERDSPDYYLGWKGMTETMEELSSVSVRDLISAYERKASATQVIYSRPRAKSLGNVLSKNVVVKKIEVTTMEDVEKALNKFQVNLSYYSVYNKQKHVELQNQLFNILTSIGNVRGNSGDDIKMRKFLTSITLDMVSSLNQKLPTNTVSNEQNAYKYTSYETSKKQKEENEQKGGREFGFLPKQMLPVSKLSTLEVEQSAISVKKLKERYQSQNQDTKILSVQNITTYNDKEEYESQHSLTLKNAVAKKPKFFETCEVETVVDGKYSEVEASYSDRGDNEKAFDLSVLKLRMLYEKKSEKSSRGLQDVLNENEPECSRFKFKVNTSYLGKQENDKLISTIPIEDANLCNTSNEDHVDESINVSNYGTANSSINEFGEDSDEHVESDSDPSSSESTASAIEIK